MQHKMERCDQNVKQVADTLVARRRFIRNLAIAAGVGTLGASESFAYPCPTGASYVCNVQFVCSDFQCLQWFQCAPAYMNAKKQLRISGSPTPPRKPMGGNSATSRDGVGGPPKTV